MHIGHCASGNERWYNALSPSNPRHFLWFQMLIPTRTCPMSAGIAMPRVNSAFARLDWAVGQRSSVTRGHGGIAGRRHPCGLGKDCCGVVPRAPPRTSPSRRGGGGDSGSRFSGRYSRYQIGNTRACGTVAAPPSPSCGSHGSCCCRLSYGACFLAAFRSAPSLFHVRTRRWFIRNQEIWDRKT